MQVLCNLFTTSLHQDSIYPGYNTEIFSSKACMIYISLVPFFCAGYNMLNYIQLWYARASLFNQIYSYSRSVRFCVIEF